MFLIKAIKYSIKKRIDEFKVAQIYKKHKNHTKYHLVDPCFEIGEFTYGIPRLYRYDKTTRLTIGKFCSIAEGVKIMLGGNHHTKRVSTYAFYQETDTFPDNGGWTQMVKGDIKIGNDVWIGRDVLILSGVTIGDGACIGAGAVVSKDIPPYAIAVGNPIRIIKYRFTESQINALENIQWWNWDKKKINENIKLLCSEDINAFLEKNSYYGK